MARRPRLFAPGVLYHVIVRGNQRQKTFTAESDYQAYIERLARYRGNAARLFKMQADQNEIRQSAKENLKS